MTTKIILDVDTGTDDAVALMVAALSPDLELVGAIVVNGNTNLDSCLENTLRVFEWIGLPETPVHRGMSRPLARLQATQPNPASRIHGDLLDLPPATITAGVLDGHKRPVGRVEGDHADRPAAVHDDARRLGVQPDVELRGGR